MIRNRIDLMKQNTGPDTKQKSRKSFGLRRFKGKNTYITGNFERVQFDMHENQHE